MAKPNVIESTKAMILELETHQAATRKLRQAMSQAAPDQLSQTDLLAMRAGMLRNLETTEGMLSRVSELLNAIVLGLTPRKPTAAKSGNFQRNIAGSRLA